MNFFQMTSNATGGLNMAWSPLSDDNTAEAYQNPMGGCRAFPVTPQKQIAVILSFIESALGIFIQLNLIRGLKLEQNVSR